MKTIVIMNTNGAKASGYRALTGGYRLPDEQGMLDNVLGDMQRGSIDHVLVKDGVSLSVWRRGCFAPRVRGGAWRLANQ